MVRVIVVTDSWTQTGRAATRPLGIYLSIYLPFG